ncbi:hypothetical protein BB560_003187, partial [Smittium megazygosporum]
GKAIYSSEDKHIARYDLETKKSKYVFRDLNFHPVSIAVTDAHIVACGGKGKLLVLNKKNELDFALKKINNDTITKLLIDNVNYNPHFSDQSYNSTNDRLIVCDNSGIIKILSLPSLAVEDRISFGIPINFASISPDNSKMAAVGDSGDVFILNRRGNSFEKIHTLEVTGTSSFACDWNHSSTLICAGSDEGFVTVWDIRNLKPITSFETTRVGEILMPCRNIKFSKRRSVDLLAVGEEDRYVNLIDTRTFRAQQIIDIDESIALGAADPINESSNQYIYSSSVAGLLFSQDCSSLFVEMFYLKLLDSKL